MKISVIIPALNEDAVISQAIASAWSAGADEVIVVDGGSDDQTVAVARQHNSQVVPSLKGRARQQNAGAAVATGDILVFLHADNRLHKSVGPQIRQALRDTSAFVGAFCQQIDASGVAYRLLEWGNTWRVRLLGLPYGDQAIFIRREDFHRIGGFQEVKLMEDLLLMQQLRRIGWPLLLPGPTFISPRRWQQHGIVQQTLRNWCLLMKYKLGWSPDQLAESYRRHDK